MPDIKITVKSKAIKPNKEEGKKNNVSLESTEGKWYTEFESDLADKIFVGGEIFFRFEANGQWNNIEQGKYQITKEGDRNATQNTGGKGKGGWKGGGNKRSPEEIAQIQLNTETTTRSIIRQVAVKAAAEFVAAVKGDKGTPAQILAVAKKLDPYMAEILPPPAASVKAGKKEADAKAEQDDFAAAAAAAGAVPAEAPAAPVEAPTDDFAKAAAAQTAGAGTPPATPEVAENGEVTDPFPQDDAPF